MEHGRIQALLKFFGYPLLSQERVKLQTSNLAGYIYRANPNKGPLKILEKMERGRIQGPGTAQIFRVPLLSQERVKLQTSNLAGTFIGPIRIKAHLKFWRKGSVDVIRESRKFSRHPCIKRIARSSLR